MRLREDLQFSIIRLRREPERYGVYSNEPRLRGLFGTPLMFDGTLEDCLEWKRLDQSGLIYMDRAQLDRYNELCETSEAARGIDPAFWERQKLKREDFIRNQVCLAEPDKEVDDDF